MLQKFLDDCRIYDYIIQQLGLDYHDHFDSKALKSAFCQFTSWFDLWHKLLFMA